MKVPRMSEANADVAVIIPWRDRGLDPHRPANLEYVEAYWRAHGFQIIVVGDGRAGDAQFNRSAAYNRGAPRTAAQILVFAEADMIVPFIQISEAIDAAHMHPGLVVPFTEYRYLNAPETLSIRAGRLRPAQARPHSVMPNGKSVGAVNVVSRDTLAAVGRWDEHFEGSWYDDNAMERAFSICTAQPTRWIEGPAYHLFHLPGHKGEHLTDADRAATAANRLRWAQYRQARTAEQIRQLIYQ